MTSDNLGLFMDDLGLIRFQRNDLNIFPLHVATTVKDYTLFQDENGRYDVTENTGSFTKLDAFSSCYVA